MRTLTLLLIALALSAALAAEGEKHALLVGVQQYGDDELGNLQYAENDVRELAEVLKQQGYPEGNVHLLTVTNAFDTHTDNLRPTAKNIAIWLKYLCKNAQPQDTVLIAFAGHGIELKDANGAYRPFYCPLEASLKDEKTLVAITDLYSDLDVKCKAHVKLLVMDACRKSRFGRDASVTMPLIPDPPGGIVAFFSCGKGQKAYESDILKHGVFFHYFIAGLKGAAASAEGDVTVPLLEDYLTRQVPRTVVLEQKNPEAEQYPERRGQVLGQVVLAKIQNHPDDNGFSEKQAEADRLYDADLPAEAQAAYLEARHLLPAASSPKRLEDRLTMTNGVLALTREFPHIGYPTKPEKKIFITTTALLSELKSTDIEIAAAAANEFGIRAEPYRIMMQKSTTILEWPAVFKRAVPRLSEMLSDNRPTRYFPYMDNP